MPMLVRMLSTRRRLTSLLLVLSVIVFAFFVRSRRRRGAVVVHTNLGWTKSVASAGNVLIVEKEDGMHLRHQKFNHPITVKDNLGEAFEERQPTKLPRSRRDGTSLRRRADVTREGIHVLFILKNS